MGGPEYLSFLEQDSKPEYRLLMGANTYRMFAGMAKSGAEGFEELTVRPKVVFSRTMQDSPEWANKTLVSDNAVDAVRAMKSRGATALCTIGSPSLSRSLLTAGLVDRYRVVVFPVVNGVTGRDRIYDGWPDPPAVRVRAHRARRAAHPGTAIASRAAVTDLDEREREACKRRNPTVG